MLGFERAGKDSFYSKLPVPISIAITFVIVFLPGFSSAPTISTPLWIIAWR